MLSIGLLFLFLFLYLIAILFGLIIGKRLYQNIKQEERGEKGQVLQRIMKTYIIIQCIAWPLTLSLFVVVSIMARTTQFTGKNLALEVFLRALISSKRFLYTLTLLYVGFNSLIVAICRYIFIVLVQHNDTFTIKKIRSWVIAASIFIPMMLAILHEATSPLNDRWLDTIRMETPANSTSVIISKYPVTNATIIVHQSPVFTIFDEYVPPAIKFGISIICTAMKLVIFSNILEGCIYLHIYIHNRRSENKETVNGSLSEESKIKRRRKKTINLQMTIISWSLEFLAGLTSLIILVFSHLDPSLLSAINIVVDSDSSVRILFVFLPVFLYFIIIPSTYLLHTEICKAYIIAHGWCKCFSNIISPERITPPQNLGQELDRNQVARSNHNVATSKYPRERSIGNLNDKLHSNQVPEHISSISGNDDVSQAIHLKVLRNNYM